MSGARFRGDRQDNIYQLLCRGGLSSFTHRNSLREGNVIDVALGQ
jgi:hypothetical protein